MVKNLEAHREGKEPRIIIPPRIQGSTLTLKNTTGTSIDGLIIRLEEPAPKRVKKKKEENEKQSQPRAEAGFDEEEDEDEENAGSIKPAREYMTEVEFQATVRTKDNKALTTNAGEVRRPEIIVQFMPVSDGELIDLDITLLNPPALEDEAEFTVIPTRNGNVVLEAKTPSKLRPRLAAYLAMFLIGEFLALVPLVIPTATASLGGLEFLPVLVGLNIIALAILAVALDKHISKPQLKVRVRHVIVLVLTALLIALVISGKTLTDVVLSQYLFVYGLILSVYFASFVVEEYIKTRVKKIDHPG